MSFNINKHPGNSAGSHGVAADAVIETGELVGPDAGGHLDSAGTAVSVSGRASSGVDNTGGADGDLSLEVERGIFACANDDTNPVDVTHIGKAVFLVAGDTVASAGTTHAGNLIGFDVDGQPIVDTTAAATNAGIAAGDA